jgi:hypothetical protein
LKIKFPDIANAGLVGGYYFVV